MPTKFRRYLKLLLALCLVLSFCLVDGQAQSRKRRTRRAKPPAPKPVITNPAIAPPEGGTGDVKIISTADQGANESEPASPSRPKTSAPAPEPENMQKTINTLSNQVNRLNDKLTQMQEDDRYQLDMERLTRAEQRAEQLRS